MAIPVILSAIGTAASVAGIAQTQQQMKQDQAMARMQAAQKKAEIEQTTEALNKVAEAAKDNPQLARAAGASIAQDQISKINGGATQAAYSDINEHLIRFVQKNYGIGGLFKGLTSAAGGAAKSGGGLFSGIKNSIKANGGVGGALKAKWNGMSTVDKITAGSTAVGLGATGVGLIQSKNQMKQQQQIATDQQQQDAANTAKLTDALNNLNNSCNQAEAGGTPSQQKNFAELGGGLGEGIGAITGSLDCFSKANNLKQSKADAIAQMQASKANNNNLVNNLNNLAASAQQKTYTMDNRRLLFNNHLNKLEQREYGFKNAMNNAKMLGKASFDFAKKNKKTLIGGLVAGVGIGAADYVGNKVIQNRMKKDGIDMVALNKYQQQKNAAAQQQSIPQYAPQMQRQYSVDNAIANNAVNPGRFGKFAKGAAGYAKEAAGSTALMGGIGFLTKNAGYNQQKGQLKDLMAEMNAAKARKSAPQQRQYAAPRFVKKVGNAIGKGVDWTSKHWNSFKSHPGESALNLASNMGGGGGRKGVQEFANHLDNYGKANNSQFLRKTAGFIKRNPKTALTGSLAVGAGVQAATWDLGTKAVEKGMRKADGAAYAYDDFQKQQVQ